MKEVRRFVSGGGYGNFNTQEDRGNIALHYAVANDSSSLVKLFLSKPETRLDYQRWSHSRVYHLQQLNDDPKLSEKSVD